MSDIGSSAESILQEHTERMWNLGRITGMSEALLEVAKLTGGEGQLYEWCLWKNGQLQREFESFINGRE